ncbi:hypothetical protein [Azospirillum argentinense]
MDWTPAKNAAKRRRTGATPQQACSLIVARLGPALQGLSGVGGNERPGRALRDRAQLGYRFWRHPSHGPEKHSARRAKTIRRWECI